MISVSNKYKEVMSRPIRNRAYLSVGIGVINQNAQEDGVASGAFEYWSHGNVFNSNQSKVEYATLEENYMKADGEMLFVPENNDFLQLQNSGIVTSDFLGAVRIDFSEVFAIKGLTLVFGSAHPTEFVVETSQKTLTYTNNAESFVTNDVLGDTDYILIKPLSMVGGQQRFRLKSVLMGVGLQYSNAQTKSFNHSDFVSTISEELPSESTTFSFYDENGLFDVDDESSFIDFLETMQQITVSFGLELDDGSVEWHQVATNYLKDWKSQKGVVSITATDRLSQMEDEYSLGNKIYTRTAYEEAESIFADAGLQPDEYFIDDYLQDVVLNNPMPIGSHKECLQLLANACRCILKQNENGRIMIQANFANVLDPDDLTVNTNGTTAWSKPNNVLLGTNIVYAELNPNFVKADGQMYFMPEPRNLLDITVQSQTINGVTFTVDGDTITANGKATANAVFDITQAITIPNNCVLSGCPSGGSGSRYLLVAKEGNNYISDNGSSVNLSANTYRIYIVVYSGYTANNLTFKPELNEVDVDSTRVLETAYVSEQVADESGLFEKNLLKVTATSQTVNGITFTVNADGSMTLNGTATASTSFVLMNKENIIENLSQYIGQKVILSGCPSGGSTSTYMLNFQGAVKDGIGCYDLGNGVEVTLSDFTDFAYLNIYIRIVSGTKMDNLTFKPMLRKADTSEDFVPYQQNPSITISMPAAYTYFGVNVDFGGNAPSELIVHTYKADALVESVKFKDLSQNAYLMHEFASFDTMSFEFTKGYPQNRVLVNKVSFGELSDYVLTRLDMMENPMGYKERRVKSVKVKVFTYQNENGKPKEVEDSVFVEKVVHAVGESKILQNPLVSTTEHATLLAEWLGNYYGNNISYDLQYRGEPRINAGDIIHMESEKKSNLQVEITSNDISFNGAFSGRIELRRALKMMEG